MLSCCIRGASASAALVTAVILSACGSQDAEPTATSRPVDGAPPTAAQVIDASIALPNEAVADTLVTLGDAVQLRLTAQDAAGRVVSDLRPQWASGDTTVAVVTDGGALQIRRSGLVRVTATVGSLTATRTFPAVLLDGAAVRDILEDPMVGRLLHGLSPTVAARVQSAFAAGGAALAAGNAPMLRTLGANVAQTLDGADDLADRAVLAVLDLYVRQLQRALSLTPED